MFRQNAFFNNSSLFALTLSISQCSDKTINIRIYFIKSRRLSISQCSDKTLIENNKEIYTKNFLSHNVQTKLKLFNIFFFINIASFYLTMFRQNSRMYIYEHCYKESFYLTMFRQNILLQTI